MSDEKTGAYITIGDIIGSTGVAIGAGASVTIQAPAPPALSLHQVPPPPLDFVGREQELTELLAHFEKGGALAAVRGQGGIGKTALALRLAEKLAPRYPEAQFYVNLRGASGNPLTPADAMAHVVRAYYPVSKLPDSEAELQGLYRTVLNNQRALLLFDDAADQAQVAPLIPTATCGLLITSRQRFTLPGLWAQDLDALPPADAVRLLVQIVGQETPPLHAIATLCGCLPLALRAAGSLLAETPDLAPAAYARELSDERARLALTGLRADGSEISVAASFTLSYARLAPEAQAVFAALAVFPASFDSAAEEAVGEDPGHKHLSELVRRSLVSYTPSPPAPPPAGEGRDSPSPIGRGVRGEGGEGGRYHLHDLACDYAATRLAPEARAQARQRHALHYKNVLVKAEDLYLEGYAALAQGLALYDLEKDNIITGQAWAAEQTPISDEAARACGAYAWQGHTLALRLHPRDHLRWLDAALAADRRLKYRQAEAAHLSMTGNAYVNLGELRTALGFHERALAVYRELRAASTEPSAEWTAAHRGVGTALGNLGIAYYSLGETRKAIDFYEQVRAIHKALGDRRDEGQDLGNLGLAYADLGETQPAVEYLEQQLTLMREIGDRGGEGRALGNLGAVYLSLDQTQKAIEYLEQQLKIVREIGDRYGEGNALWNLSLALDTAGDRAQAIARAHDALGIFVELESPHAQRVKKKLDEWEAGSAKGAK